jgi:hypothetical protein
MLSGSCLSSSKSSESESESDVEISKICLNRSIIPFPSISYCPLKNNEFDELMDTICAISENKKEQKKENTSILNDCIMTFPMSCGNQFQLTDMSAITAPFEQADALLISMNQLQVNHVVILVQPNCAPSTSISLNEYMTQFVNIAPAAIQKQITKKKLSIMCMNKIGIIFGPPIDL